VVSDELRAARLVRRLEGQLPGAAAAERRVWSRLAEPPARGNRTWIAQLAATVALAVVVLVAGAWIASYRLSVGHSGLPVLYREEVARTEISAAGVSGSLAIQERFFATPDALRVVAQADVRLDAAALPTSVEVRYRERGDGTEGVLARSGGITEALVGGQAHFDITAPLPPVARGQVRSFEVWLYLEAASGNVDGARIAVEVRGAPEGERARRID
jgi:hypothetical protein